jgi:hypothetical protein
VNEGKTRFAKIMKFALGRIIGRHGVNSGVRTLDITDSLLFF